MKYVAVLLAAFMLVLSATSGMLEANAMAASAKKTCCPKGMDKMSCGKTNHSDQKKPCEKDGACSMFLSCSICGFFTTEPMSLSHQLFYQIKKPDTPYHIGELSDYNPSGRKPPKV